MPSLPRPILLAALLFSAIAVAVAASGCGEASSAPREKELTIGHAGWEEGLAFAALVQVLLEDRLGYDVELREAGQEEVLRGVATGEVDATGGLWMPTHTRALTRAEKDGDADILNPWFYGVTRQSLAVPDYVDARTVSELDDAGVETLLEVRPGGMPFEPPADPPVLRGIERVQVPDTKTLFREAEERRERRERFAFAAYSPHWINERLDFEYLEDPKEELGDFTTPARIHPVVRPGLGGDDPVAYALLDDVRLAEYQVEDIERKVRKKGDPAEGVRAWLRADKDNRNLVKGWVKAARERE